MRQYLHALYCALPFAIIIPILVYFTNPHSLKMMIFSVSLTFVLASLSEAWLIFRHRLYIYNQGYGRSEEVCFLNQMRTITMNVPRYSTDDLCVASIKDIPRCKIDNKSRFTNRIVARAGHNLKYVGLYEKNLFAYTWGEIITFDLTSIDDNHTRVIVRSRPICPIILMPVDFGKNLRNVEKILHYLKVHNPREVF